MKRVVVIGTGIVGAVTSYLLARKSYKVTMIDSGEIGRATHAAAGMINPWTTQRRNKAWYTLASAGAKLYPTLISYLTDDGMTRIGYEKRGALHLYNDETTLNNFYNRLQERQQNEPAIGTIEILDEQTTYDLFPYTEKQYKGIYISGIARIDGQRLTDAFIKAAQLHGAERIHGQAKLLIEQNCSSGVSVNGTNIYADATIAANGIWMPMLLKPTGLQIDVTIQQGEIIHIQTDQEMEHLPTVIPPSNKYIMPLAQGRFAIGTTFKKVTFTEKNDTVSTKNIYEILHETLQVAPKLAYSQIIDMRMGYRPYTSDSLPVFGPVPSINNLYAANGLGASGLSTGPMIGYQLAKLIAEEPLDLPLEHYSLAHALI